MKLLLWTLFLLVNPSAALPEYAASRDTFGYNYGVSYPQRAAGNPVKFELLHGESKLDGCLRCCKEGFNQPYHQSMVNGEFKEIKRQKSMCSFTGIEVNLDECSMKCGEVYPDPEDKPRHVVPFQMDFVQTGSQTKAKIIHEAFESLAQTDKKNAETSASIASSAEEAIATLSNQAKVNAGLDSVMKALRATQSGEDEASKAAKVAEKNDKALAAASKVQEKKLDMIIKRADDMLPQLTAVSVPPNVPNVLLQRSSSSQGCSLECLKKVGKCTCQKARESKVDNSQNKAPAFLQKSSLGCSLECLKKVGKCTCH